MTSFFLKDYSGVEAGLAVTQAISMTLTMQWGTRKSVEVSSLLTSLERILEYANLTSESSAREECFRGKQTLENKVEYILMETPYGWPSCGRIIFENVCMRFAVDDPPVLNNVNLDIAAAEKVS